MEQTVQLKKNLADMENWHQKEEQLKRQIDNLQETVNRHEQKEHERLKVEHAYALQKLAHLERQEQQEQQAKMQRQEQENRVRRQALIRRDAETSPVVESAETKEPPIDDDKDDDQDRRSSVNLTRRDDAVAAEVKHESAIQDQAANNAEGHDQHLISVDSSSSDDLVSVTVVKPDMTTSKSTTAAHRQVVAVEEPRNEEDFWMEIADGDAKQHQATSVVMQTMEGAATHCCNNDAKNVVLHEQSTATPEDLVVLSEIANIAPITAGETDTDRTEDDSKMKIVSGNVRDSTIAAGRCYD
jgi:hypothetical protein